VNRQWTWMMMLAACAPDPVVEQPSCKDGYTRTTQEDCVQTDVEVGPEYDTAPVGSNEDNEQDFSSMNTRLVGSVQLAPDTSAASLAELRIEAWNAWSLDDEGSPESEVYTSSGMLQVDLEDLSEASLSVELECLVSPRTQVLGLHVFAVVERFDPETGVRLPAELITPDGGNPLYCVPEEDCEGIDFTL
jgi:hypothetical protein